MNIQQTLDNRIVSALIMYNEAGGLPVFFDQSQLENLKVTFFIICDWVARINLILVHWIK